MQPTIAVLVFGVLVVAAEIYIMVRAAGAGRGRRQPAADRSGNTPLQLARMRGYREMVEILEKAGAK